MNPLEDDPFLLGRPIFRGELLNFGSVYFMLYLAYLAHYLEDGPPLSK